MRPIVIITSLLLAAASAGASPPIASHLPTKAQPLQIAQLDAALAHIREINKVYSDQAEQAAKPYSDHVTSILAELKIKQDDFAVAGQRLDDEARKHAVVVNLLTGEISRPPPAAAAPAKALEPSKKTADASPAKVPVAVPADKAATPKEPVKVASGPKPDKAPKK